MTMTLTENAAKQIRAQLDKRGQGLGLRISVKQVGCSGYGYVFDYADAIDADDLVVEAHGAKVVVPTNSVEFLEGATLDFVREGLKQIFKVNNPNVDATCGCGESFSIKKPALEEATTPSA